MALGSEAPTSFKHSGRMTAALLLVVCVTLTQSAPTTYDEIEARRTDLTDYFNNPNGCYYNYQHYEEGDRIVTNEPCLNCTCLNRMLMCYLRVCPFSKAIGQDCTVQKSPDQCCPTISCPEVPVQLLTSSTTPRPTTTTEIGWHDNYGCMMNDNEFFPDGAQVPSDLKKPCELCYCIRNRTACVMQECTLHVEGCRPVYQDGVCCPVRYDCDYENEKSTTTTPQISGGLVFSTTSAPFDCRVNDDVYRDGESIAMVSEKPCQHCYCMRGDIVCAVQDCGEPLRGKHCTPETPPAGQCCPTSYQCANETISSDDITTLLPASQSDTDENEAEKYPTNEDIYDKLGEHQPSQDDTNEVNSDHAYTTLVYNNEISSVESSDQTTIKNEVNKNSVSGDNHNVVEKPNILPPSDNVNKIIEENKQEISNNKPELTNQVNIISTESPQTKYESTDKPVEPTLVEEAQPTESLPADVQLNENVISPTIQTISDDNNVKISEENNKSPVENTSQNDLISNLPVATTENSIESETQSINLKDNPQEGIQQQTADTPSVVVNEPVKYNNDGHDAETKPQTEITFNEKQDPPKQSNEENTESYMEENKIKTSTPLSEDIEQTTHKLTQHDNEKAPLEESNTQTDTSSNNGQNSVDKNNQDINQLPQEDNNSHKENPSGVLNNGKPQAENESSTEIPEVENEPTEQNNLPVDGKPQTQNKPIELNQDSLQENVPPTETPKVENEPIEQNQDSSPVENESSTEIPKVVNEPIEQNNLPVDGKPQVENQSESQTSPTEQNQDNPLVENETSTEIPKIENEPTQQNINIPVENKPQPENQPESQSTPTKQNQDNLQEENISPTGTPNIENESTEKYNLPVDGKPQVETQPESQTSPAEQNQDSLPVENESSTEIPKVVNEPTKQNNLPVDGKPQVENQSESQTSPTEQNQDSPPVENETSTEIPKIVNESTEQNNLPVDGKPQVENQPESETSPTEQNQHSPPVENESSTEIKIEPTGQNNNIPAENKPQIENQPNSQDAPTEQNQSNLQENVSPTEIPQVENEPTEQNNIPVENKPQTENQPESSYAPTEQNQDSLQENVSPTEIPQIDNEPQFQNTPIEQNQDNSQENVSPTEIPQVENEPQFQNTPTEQNQSNSQENVSPTEIPKTENQQNNLPVENKPQIETQPESQNKPVEQNQNNPHIGNLSPTEIPLKLNEPQSENITPTKPVVPAVSQNDVSTEQPNEDNNIFVVSPTSPPLFSQNQIKGEESTSVLNENDNSDKYSSTEKNVDTIIENSQSSVDDKTSPAENTNTDNVSTITEVTPENNGSPQTNNKNTEQSTEIKLTENEENSGIPNDKSNSTVNSHEQTPINEEHNDNRFGSNKPDNAKPTTETNYDVNSVTTIQSMLVDNTSSQEHQLGNKHSVDKENQSIPNVDSVEHQNAPQTETSTEVGTSENENPSSVDEHLNYVTTSLPQQQITDDNTPVKSEDVNHSGLNTTLDETKTSNNLSVNNIPEKTANSPLPIEISEIQHSNPTESSVLDTSNVEQSTNTYPSEQNNEFENATPHGQSQDENVNEILDQTSVYPEILSDDKNELNIATGSNQSNKENVTPLSEIIENDTNAQNIGKEPVKNINKDGIEYEITTISQTEQINHESSENANNVDNLVPSVAPNKDAPSSQSGVNDASPSPANLPSNIETNNNQPENFGTQQSVNSDETSTQYNIDDSSTNNPIQESPNTNVNNNAEASTNVPSNSEIPNEINQDSVTESELYPTQSPTEKNTLNADSNKAPDNDATMEVNTNLPEHTNSSSEINANEIINEKPSENPQNADKPSTPETPSYVIDITTYSPSESLNNVAESINTEDEVNEATISSIDKNNEMTTELYENIQPGIPGEGSCLINFVTYAHKAEVPKSNPCHEKCECLNSIVTCTSVNCPPAPPQHRNCIPLHPGNESWCCPTYMCEGGIEGMLFEGHNQLGSPQLISTVLLEDKPGEENDEKTPIDEEVPSTSSPQITLEYNTLAPSNPDTNSDVNSQDPTQTEIPNKPMEDSVGANGENNIPVTTIINETVENENDRPIESDQSSENEKLYGTSEKPIENELSVNEKPVENDKLEENDKPIENNQSAEPEKPINSSEADFTTISYEDNSQTVTNKPDTSNNIEGQNTLSNSGNESQDYPVPSTEIPSYEPTITNVLPTNDQNQPESNSGLENTITATTFEPNDSVVEQQVDNNKSGANEPTSNEQSNASPVDYVTDLPESNVNPLETTHIPNIIDDTKPMLVENNADGLRPTSIDDIISSVNMVKDAVKNSLETLSKPVENNYQTTEVIENHQPTTVPEYSAGPPAENSLPDKYNGPQTAVNGTSIVPELQTDAVDEKSTESPTAVQPSDELGATQVPTSPPSASTDQGVPTDLPLYVPTKQEIPASTSDGDVNHVAGETADDKTPEITTTRYSPDPAEQDPTSNGPATSGGDSNAPQANVESNANPADAAVVGDKSPEISTQALPSAAQHDGIPVDDKKPAAEEYPNTESPVSPGSDVNNNNAATGAVPAQAAAGHSTTAPDDTDKRFGGEPSSSPAPSVAQDDKRPQEDDKRPQQDDKRPQQDDKRPQQDDKRPQQDDKRPQESGETVNAPPQSDTEKPPSASTPSVPPHRPSYTPIPQSTWTQKPFHHESTSEAPQQPDQSIPDDYEDENEAVYGPGTCRYGGKVYVSAQQVPRDDPCDFCFCFRGDIICLQQSCPPPIFGCYQENINGFCCPRYECPVAQATSVNVTTTTTTTTTMVPPHFFANAYRGAARRAGCLIHGHAYRVGEDVGVASGPCLECICGADGKMKCDPKSCSPEPLLRKMLVEAVDGQTDRR